MPLDPEVRELATAEHFAVLTTLLPDGRPQTHVMWIDADERHLLVNTEVHRQKYANIQRDPRVTVAIWLLDDPYRYVEVRGRVVESVGGDEARRHIDAMARRYVGRDYPGEITSERVILRIEAERVNKRL